MRKFVMLGSVGLGMLTVAPLFWFLGRAAGEGLPVGLEFIALAAVRTCSSRR